ncbi:MAG: acc operon protein [Halanaeroarchaeum sp.]
METSRSDLAVPATADAEETAAIVAAIRAHLAARERAADGEEGDGWRGREWRFAGTLDRTNGRSKRVPRSAPTDAWTAAGRADRF